MKQVASLVFYAFVNLTTGSLSAQAPVVEWQKCFGGNNGDYANSIVQTSDGGYIVAGTTEGTDNADVMGYHGNPEIQDLWVVKMNNTGTIQWTKCIGGLYSEVGGYIRQTSDGGYIVAGSSASVDCDITGNHGGLDYWLVKLNDKGDIQWRKMMGGNRNDYLLSIDLTPDGGYVMAGHSESSDGDLTINHGNRDCWVVKVNSIGIIQWQKALGGSDEEGANSVKSTPDGGCVIAGYSYSNDDDLTFNHGARDCWVVKLDNTGNLQWQKNFGGSDFDEGRSIQLATDGGYIIAGYTRSIDGDVSGNHTTTPGSEDFWVLKLDNSGTLQWQKCYGGNLNDVAHSILPTADGGYIVAGSAESSTGDATCNSGILDMWIIKINNTGVIQWQKSLGGNYYDEAYDIQFSNDGGYIVAGNTCSSNISGWHAHSTSTGTCGDFWVVKLAAPSAIPLNPVVTIDPASASVCSGNPSTLTAIARYAGTNPTYRWERNALTVGGNSSSYTASDFVDNEIVRCFVTRGSPCEPGGSQASDAITIKINSNVIQPNITIAADNTIICPCTTVTFKATVTNGGASPKFLWYLNSINTGVDKDFFTSSNFKSGDIISCVYSDNSSCIANGLVYSNSIQLFAASGQTPTVSINTLANNVCSGIPITFTATTVNAGINPKYQWKINGTNTGTNSNTFTSSVLLNGDVISCTINSDPLFTCITAATANSNNIVVNINNTLVPSVSITSSATTICAGSPVTFSANTTNAGSNPSYQWTINGINSGTNSNTFTNSVLVNGDVVSCTINTDPLFTCTISTTANSNNIVANINNTLIPSVSITSSAITICAGNPVTFTATTINTGSNPSYQWTINGLNTGTNSNTFTTSSLSNSDIVDCKINTDPLFLCVSSTTATSNDIIININNVAAPSISISSSTNDVCKGTAVSFSATVTNASSSPIYQWKLNNNNTGTNSPTFSSNILSNDDQIYCEISVGNGSCFNSTIISNTIIAKINDLPTITIVPDDTTVSSGSQVQLNAVVSGIIGSFQWDPSNQLENPLSLTPSTTPLNSNTNYTLQVVSDNGCPASKTVTVKIQLPFSMPNAFTPNNDGLNDIFRIPQGIYFSLNEFAVYDRWGNKVFSTRNINEGWDGTYKATKSVSGIYIYMITGSNDKGEIFLKGSFALIR